MNENPHPENCRSCGWSWSRCEKMRSLSGVVCCTDCRENVAHNQDQAPPLTATEQIDAEINALLRTISKLEAKRKTLMSYPVEPEPADDINVVWWQHQWGDNTQIYTYSAVRIVATGQWQMYDGMSTNCKWQAPGANSWGR